jgi:hypothetical protein
MYDQRIAELEAENARLREAISPGRVGRSVDHYVKVAERLRSLDQRIIPPGDLETSHVFSRPECIFAYCPHPERCEEKCQHRTAIEAGG